MAIGLQIVGALSLLLLLVVAALVAAFLMGNAKDRIDGAKPGDVVHVFNRGGIDPGQEYSIIYSQQSAWAFGDHVDFYCIQIERFPEHSGMWRRSGHPDEFRSDARNTAAKLGNLERCFGVRAEGNSDSLIARVHQFNVFDNQVQGAVVTFYHEDTMRLLHVSYRF